MGNKINGLLQVLVIIARDMFIGMIFGISAAILLTKINPHSENYGALLIPIGITAGILKGFSKFLVLNRFSSLTSMGYRLFYPKYKILFLWVVILLGTLLYSYGFNFSKWAAVPLKMFLLNRITGSLNTDFWTILIVAVAVIGTVSYLYEPPYNDGKYLPPEEVLPSEED